MKRKWYYLAVTVAMTFFPLGTGLIWCFRHMFMSGHRSTAEFDLMVGRLFTPQDRVFWYVTAFYLVVLLVINLCGAFDANGEGSDSNGFGDKEDISRRATGRLSIIFGVVLLTIIVGLSYQGWGNKDTYSFYNKDAQFAVTDTDAMPSSLKYLVDGAKTGTGDCKLEGSHDVPSCVIEKQLDAEGWENRAASLAGAKKVMSQMSGEDQRAKLMTTTLTHIYPPADEAVNADAEASSGYWTGIRDAEGTEGDIEGVVEWDGVSQPTSCIFKGNYEINRSLQGEKANSLTNLIGTTYPKVRFNIDDAYGYCDGENKDVPTVVLPVNVNVRQGMRSMEAPGGVIIMTGSSSGVPNLVYKPNVKEGEVPGPVYAITIAAKQREETKWAAGAKNEDKYSFGFDATTAASQTGNATEFLLRSRKDGRTYWVTPLVLRESDSQVVVAYSVIPANSVNSGELNTMTVYVLDKDDDRSVNLDQMERDITDFVTQSPKRATFFTKGALQEFTPAAGISWRIFGTIDGDPFFVVEVADPDKTEFVLTELRENGTEEEVDESGDINPCAGESLSALEPSRLIACAQAALDELESRESAQK